jgi:putative flippase GtrA
MPRALVVSILAMFVNVAVMCLMVDLAHFDARLANVVGYLAGGVLQYVACSVWVFPNAPRNVAIGFVAFTVLSLGGLAISTLTIHLLHNQWGIPWKLVMVVAFGLTFNWNFFTRKFFLFQPEGSSIPAHE